MLKTIALTLTGLALVQGSDTRLRAGAKPPVLHVITHVGCSGSPPCPAALPHKYGGTNRCFQRVWGGHMCSSCPETSRAEQRGDLACRDIPQKVLADIHWYGAWLNTLNTREVLK